MQNIDLFLYSIILFVLEITETKIKPMNKIKRI